MNSAEEALNSDEEANMQLIELLDTEDLKAQSDEDTTSSLSSASDVNNYTCFENGMFLQTKLMKNYMTQMLRTFFLNKS